MSQRLKFDGMKFGWLADGRWPRKFWKAFWIHRQFTLLGPMTTVAMGPLVVWIYWHYELAGGAGRGGEGK